MLNHYPFSSQTPIALFFSFFQSMVFGFLERCLVVLVEFRQSLIASIRQNAKVFNELMFIIFKQLEVVITSRTKRCGYDLSTFSIRRFLGIKFLFATIMPFGAFSGRSTGCSLTSISTTVSLLRVLSC